MLHHSHSLNDQDASMASRLNLGGSWRMLTLIGATVLVVVTLIEGRSAPLYRQGFHMIPQFGVLVSTIDNF